MNKIISITIVVAAILLLASQASAAPTWDKDPAAFVHGIALDIDGENWYFVGVGSVGLPDNEPVTDVPGHTWVQTGPNHVVGRHYNVGPYNESTENHELSWWASGEPDGVLLFKVDGIIAPLGLDPNSGYGAHLQKKGYVHVHELVNETNVQNQDIGVYLKHTAVREFYLFDVFHVTPGVYDFIPNW